MRQIHPRMPVILSPENQKAWLNPAIKDDETLKSLLLPYDPEKMDLYPISRDINYVKNDFPELIQPVND